jgi:flagellar biogenesis protein FliO
VKRLYIVTMGDSAVVLAGSPEEAERIARDHRLEMEWEVEQVSEFDHYPAAWDTDSEPFGGDGKYLAVLIGEGHAPKYAEMMAKLAATRGPGSKS